MNSNWFWKPVLMGTIILGLLGFLFSTLLIAILTCPGLKAECVARSPTILSDVFLVGWQLILISGAAGAVVGGIYAVIRRQIKKGRKGTKQSG